jgi:hypothetical protein
MARDPISRLYEKHRSFPRGKNSENHPRPQSPASYDRSPRDGALRRNTPQDIEDRPDYAAGYSNDVDKKSWLQSGKATDKPFFDKNQSYRHDDKGNARGKSDTKDYRDADHRNHWSEFEHTHNAGTTQSNDFRSPGKKSVPSYEKRGRNDLQPSVANRDGGEGKTTAATRNAIKGLKR